MTEQDLMHKIEWVNKRCSLKGEPLTQSQIELLMFVFADNVVSENSASDDVSDTVYDPNWEIIQTAPHGIQYKHKKTGETKWE
jgi:hypothetical protein